MIRHDVSKPIACLLFVVAIAFSAIAEPVESAPRSGGNLPSVQQMIDARTDVWGDVAMGQPDGASYDFFKDLLPPLRWVNTEFRYYPIVLSAPRAAEKIRLISNGSAINAMANKPPMWLEQGVPVKFSVGDEVEVFGSEPSRLEQPSYLNGYLPIVQMRYKAGDATYEEEVFAPVEEKAGATGTAMVRFSLARGTAKSGRVEAHIDSKPLHLKNNAIVDGKGRMLVSFSQNWSLEPKFRTLIADLKPNETAELQIYTKPTETDSRLTAARYDQQKQQCVEKWRSVLAHGTKIETPEAIVNDAWRATIIGNLMIAVGDRPNYSTGNAYGHLYEGECGDTLRSLLLFGQPDLLPGMLKTMLEFNRKDTRFHVAGQKLQLLAYIYWLTRDAEMVRSLEPQWRPSVELILTSRESGSGLLPKDRYAGDIATKVYSLNSNANCCRGLRDVAAVLEEIGSKDEAKKLRDEAAVYRTAILKAVDRSVRSESKPPFIPISLLADEEAHDPLTATRFGSYYDLICPYIIGSEIFGQGSQREDWLLGYLQNHGGVAMGMIRTEPHQGEFKGEAGVNPLYGLRYQLALLRRDEREKALVGFYGQLAQGMTRGTFIGGEGSRFRHGDANGRSFYLPPNSTSNAAWLVTLRYLLIQDWDLDEDGKPDSLRLMFGTPRRWLADGGKVHIENAPTTFGRISLQAESRLSAGYVNVRVTPPPRTAKTMLLRAPLPAAWKISSAEIDGKSAALRDGDSVDLTGMAKPVSVRFEVKAMAEGRP